MQQVFKLKRNKGFTLVELLVVIAIIAILFAVVLVAVNPAQRFKDSRNSRRLADVKSIVEAATTYTADRRGAQLPDVPDYQCVGSKPAQDFQTTPPTGSTALWKMDEASGVLADSAGATQNNIPLVNIANITYDVSGKFNKAVQMNGATSSLAANDDAELDPVSSALTLEGWIKLNQKIEPGSFDHHLPLFDKGNYRLQINSESGKLEFDTRNPSGSSTEYNSSTDDNTIKGINTIAQFQDSLYAGALIIQTCIGGTNNGATCTQNSDCDSNICLPLEAEGRILKKDSGVWSVVSGYPTGSVNVNSLAVYNAKLYSGQSSSDDSARVYSFDGNSWSDTGLNIANASVLSLARYKGKLYAGIGIEPPNTGGGSIWEYDGLSWRSSKDFAVSEALAVYSFSIFQGKLFAGTGRGEADQGARLFEFNGNSWVERFDSNDMTTPITDPDPDPNPKDAVYSLAVFNKNLYIGLGGDIDTDGVVYRWDGAAANSSILDTPPNPRRPRVLALVAYNNMINVAWSGTLDTHGAIYYYSGGWTRRSNAVNEVDPATEVKALANYYGKLYAATRGDTTSEAKIHTFGTNGFIESEKSTWYPNVWYHVAGVYDGSAGQMKIVKNGNVDNSITSGVPASIPTNSAPLYIGAGRSGDPFSGTLDNLAIYNNTALSADEVASHAGCYNLGQYLAPEYMGSLPIDPSSTVTDGTDTGYFISKDTGGVITITAPLTETSSSVPEIIKASR